MNVHGMFVFTHITIRDDAVVSIYIYIYIKQCVGYGMMFSCLVILSECTWRVRVYPHNNQK